MSDLTQMLRAVEAGDSAAADQLLPLVYDELRRLAAHRMASEAGPHTLQPTALVHEAWLRLGGDEQPNWENRRHFFAAAAEAMRRILIERARRRRTRRHGGELERVDLDEIEIAAPMAEDEMLAVHEALDQFGREDPTKAELVKLRYFAGMTLEEAGEVLEISEATAVRWWRYARAWLYHAIHQAHR